MGGGGESSVLRKLEVLLMRRKMYVDEGRCERNEIHCSLGGEFRKVAYEIDV